MGDLKNKFMDILFDEEPETEIGEDMDISNVSKDASFVDAKELLYRKSGTSAFIDLDTTPKAEDIPAKNDDTYEMSTQISPIFGVINENKKKTINVAPEVTESQTTKPADSHLDIITSPIYGYGNKEDAYDNNYDVKGINDEDDELHHLFDMKEEEDNDLLSEDAFDEDEISLFRLFGDNK